jgi:hypothetical protein
MGLRMQDARAAATPVVVTDRNNRRRARKRRQGPAEWPKSIIGNAQFTIRDFRHASRQGEYAAPAF